jgi:elongation factor Ts
MKMSNFELVKKLRQKMGLSLKDCVKAVENSGGDFEKAKAWLREHGKKPIADPDSAKEGIIGSYIHHNNRIGVLVEVNCNTDFTARNDEFKQFARNIAMHIAAAKPKYVSQDDIPTDVLEKEKIFLKEQAKKTGKPEHIIEQKIIPGKLKQFFKEICLMDQIFVADTNTTIKGLVENMSAKVNETIVIKRFVRYELGKA